MRALIIEDSLKQTIAGVVERAKSKVVSQELLETHKVEAKGALKLSDRPKGYVNPGHPEMIDIPVGYTAAYSVEEQPIGLCGHLSVSVDVKELCPNQIAMEEIAMLFGMPRDRWEAVWVEEYEPNYWAVNVICPL